VQKIEKSPALPKFTGRLIKSVIIPTPKKTTALAISSDSRNFQLTELHKNIKLVSLSLGVSSDNLPKV